MANKTVQVNIQFSDVSNSLGAITKKLSGLTLNKKLSAPLVDDIKQVSSGVDQFQSKIKSIDTKSMKLIDLQNIQNEGETLKASLISTIKAIEKEFKGANLTGDQIAKLNKYKESIQNSKVAVSELKDQLKSAERISSDFAIPEGMNQGHTIISTLSDDIEKYKKRLKSLNDIKSEGGTLTDKQEVERQNLEAGIPVLKKEIDKQEELRLKILEKIAAQQLEQASYKAKISEIENKGKAATAEEIRQLDLLKTQLDQVNKSQEQNQKNIDIVADKQRRYGVVSEETSKKLGGMVARFFSLQAIIGQLRRVLRQGIQAVQELDKSFTEIAMVTSYTNKEVWKMKDSFLELSKTTGLTVTEVSKLSVEFFRQGRSLSETIKLVEAAGIAAKLAGISTTDSVRYLTSAINGYQLAADQAMVVSDKFASLAAASATDYEELATALSKVSSQAYAAGVGMDNMLGFIAKALEVTREAPENIGTAFKTIFARMQEIKDYGATLEDGMDVNRVDKALGIINVSLRDQSGEIRNLDDVLIDVGKKWKGLDKNQKAYITTALAGTRQQTRLLAVFEDFDRTLELTKVSSDSLGASYAQQQKYYASIEYAITRLKTAWQDFITNIVSSDLVIFLTNILAKFVEILNAIAGNKFGQFALIITGLTYAFIGLREAMNVAAITEFMKVISKSNTVFVNLIKSITSGTVAKEIDNAVTLKKILLAYGDTEAQVAETLATNAATKSLYAKAVAFAVANPLAAAAVAVTAALVVALGAFTYNAWKANGNLKNLTETTRKYNASIYDTKKKVNDIDGLVSKYEELANQINLTSEEEAKMSEYAQQIQDLLGEDYNVVNFNGELDLESVKNAVNELTAQSDEDFNKLVKNVKDGLSRLTYSFSDMDFASRSALNLSDAIHDAGVANREEFSKLDEQTQNYWLKIADARNKALSTKVENKNVVTTQTNNGLPTGTTTGGLTNITTQTVTIVPELDDTQIEALNAKLTEDVFSDWEASGAYDRAERLITLGYNKMSEAEQNYVNNVLGGAAAIQKINDLYANDITTRDAILKALGTNIDQYDELMTKMSDLGFNEKDQKVIVGDIISKGAATAFNNFIKTTEAGTKSFDELVSLATTFNELEFKNVDTIASLGELKGAATAFEKAGKMLSGEEEFDMKSLQELVQTYPEIAKFIADNGKLTKEEISEAMKLQNEAAKNDLLNQNIQYENQIKLLEAEYAAYESLLEGEWAAQVAQTGAFAELEAAGLQAMLDDKKLAIDAGNDYDIQQKAITENAKKLIAEAAAKDEVLSLTEARRQAASALGYDINADIAIPTLTGGKFDTTAAEGVRESIQATMDSIRDRIDQYKALIEINNYAIEQIDNKTLFRDATDAAEEYAAQLNEIYILEQQIAALQSELDEYKFMEENAKTGEEYVTSIAAQNKILESQLELTNQLVNAQKAQQDTLYNNLGGLQDTVTIINGRLVPVMSKYVNLSDDSQKLIDETVNSYNDLSAGINDNTMSIKENTLAIEENLQKIEDKTVEFYDILADAIKNSEKKKLDELNKGLDEERKILDKRKQMYEDAFAEEDFTNELSDVNKKRADIIAKLAALEGATDLASVEKKKSLIEEKNDLDKEYNTKLRDYNKDALFQQLEDEGNYLDDLQEEYEAAYEERVSSIEWLESEVTRIINSGLDETIQYLKENSPEYIDAWSLQKDNIEDLWTDLYDVVKTKVDDISSNIPDFSAMLAQLRDAISYMGQLKDLGGDGIDDSGSGDGSTKTKKVWVYNNKEYSTFKEADDALTNDLSRAQTNLAGAKKALASAPSSYALQQVVKDAQAAYDSVLGRKITSKFVSARSGGLIDYTGLAMLHGTPTKPESVLSPVQTELFDSMVSALEKLSMGSSDSSENISIGNITIQTPQLNTNLDFAAAGQSLASELARAISERGININKRK